MENNLDTWAQELKREAECCLSGFTLKVKAFEILRDLGQFDGKFYASDGWLRGFLHRRGTCGGTEDEDEDDKEDEEEKEEEEEDDEEKTDSKVAQKVKQILSSLDLTPKTLKAKRKKPTARSSKTKSCVCQAYLETCLHLMARTTLNLMTVIKVNNLFKTSIEHYNYFNFI